MAQKTAPDSTRRSERSRRAIYEAALALVGEVGYPKMTIEAIAARAGVGKQTIYRWWPSKSAVLLDAFLDLSEQASAELSEKAGLDEVATAIPDTGDLEADLKYVLRATVDEMTNPKFDAPARALAAEGVVNEQLGAEFLEKLLEPQLQLYVDRLRAAKEQGQVAPGIDPRIALELWTGPLAQRWMQRTGPLSHAYADKLVEYALYGIAPR
ncbi:TetR/AcrR family transcriptional regulator [Streptomyces aurantiacus]|uniref:Putative HTH-type transcriptional regulator YdeS n=1 Tax=Streptomyces aurantiacus JA 4570 TaxID=1286094 RepID=S3ZMB9_9ACTN|nr:TetR/AcrR family transcriptional regulator [Streptomyces aurantiacus]EPH44358.1 putative HTH-type transcriptional regulator YdeS [Streptomyces aurantiacus JA 4570]